MGLVSMTGVVWPGGNDVSIIIIGRQGTSTLTAHDIDGLGARLVQVTGCAVTIVP